MFHFFRKSKSFLPAFTTKDIVVLAGGVFAYIGLTASTVDKFSIWFDEAFGSYLVRFNVADLTRYTANDVHPPFYYWLLKLWTDLFGNTELGIRSMSIFFGVLTIIFAFTLVVKLFGRRAAYTSLLFLVLSPMFIRYGQEARMYTLLTAIIIVATYVLVYATETKKRWAWVTYGVLIAVGMLTQYFAALAWVSHWVWRFITVRTYGEKFGATVRKVLSKQWLVAHGIALLIFAFWLPFLVIQFFTIQGFGFWIKPVTSTTVTDFFTNVLFFGDSNGVTSWLAAGFYVILATFVILGVRLYRLLDGEQKSNYLLLVVMIIVPILLLIVLSLPPLRPAFVDRYLMGSMVIIALFMGVTTALSSKFIRRRSQIALGLVVAGCFVVGIFNQATIGNYNRASGQSNNVRQLIEKIRDEEAPDAKIAIIASSPWIFYESSIYIDQKTSISYVNETTQYKYGSLTALAENDIFKIRDVDAYGQMTKRFWVIANLNENQPDALRKSWQQQRTIVINDDLTDKPLFKAVEFSVE